MRTPRQLIQAAGPPDENDHFLAFAEVLGQAQLLS